MGLGDDFEDGVNKVNSAWAKRDIIYGGRDNEAPKPAPQSNSFVDWSSPSDSTTTSSGRRAGATVITALIIYVTIGLFSDGNNAVAWWIIGWFPVLWITDAFFFRN